MSWSWPPDTMFIYNQAGGVAGLRQAGLAPPPASPAAPSRGQERDHQQGEPGSVAELTKRWSRRQSKCSLAPGGQGWGLQKAE